LLKKRKRPVEAAQYLEELARLAERWEPTSVKTARDLFQLALLYIELNRVSDACTALGQAIRAYTNLPPQERELLEPNEIKRAEDLLARERKSLEQLTAPRSQCTNGGCEAETLLRIRRTLEREAPRLVQFPAAVNQQIVNDLPGEECLGEYLPTTSLEGLRGTYSRFLQGKQRPWVELRSVRGPGQLFWSTRYSAARTAFPDKIEHFLTISTGRLLAFCENGHTWIAKVGARPTLTSVQLAPRSGKCQVAATGSAIAVIDGNSKLQLFEVLNGEIGRVQQPLTGVARVVASQNGFLVQLCDKTLIGIGEKGDTQTRSGARLEGDLLAVSANGTTAVLGLNLDGARSEVNLVDTVTMRKIAEWRSQSYYVHTAYATAANSVFLGCMDGLWLWNMPWDREPVRASAGTVSGIAISAGNTYMAVSGADVTVSEFGESTRWAVISPPGDGPIASGLAFSRTGENDLLHLVGEHLVETWDLRQVWWRDSAEDFRRNTLTQAEFDDDCVRLGALGLQGERYVWDVASGHLVQYEPEEDEEKFLIAWSSNGRRGAVCHHEKVEVLDADGRPEGYIEATMPHGACWDASGKRLAFAARFSELITIVSVEETWDSSQITTWKEEFPASALALSPDGHVLAYARGVMGPTFGSHGFHVRGFIANPVLKEFGLETGVVLVRLDSNNRRIILEDHPHTFRLVRFLDQSLLLAADTEGGVLLVDTGSGDVLARWWALSPIVGVGRKGEASFWADSGEGPGHSPLVYEVHLHRTTKENISQ
jgi:hypothetical protein